MGLLADRLTKSTTQADYVRQQIAQAEAQASPPSEEEPSWYESMANDVASIFNSDESIGDKLLDTASYAINGVGNGIQTVADAGVDVLKGGMGFVGNAVSDIGDWAYATGDKISAAYENPSFDSVWEAYEQGIAKPGMAVAATPFIPGQARAVAGALALPSVASGAINSFNEGDDAIEGAGNVVNSFVVDPVSQLVKAASNPVETGQKIYEHPSAIWTDILEPGMVVEMPARGVKKAYDNRGEIKADYKAFKEDGINGVFDRHIDEGFKDLGHSLRSNVDDGSIREPYTPEESYSYEDYDYAPEEAAPSWDIREDEFIGQPMPHGENGCVEAVVRLGQDNDFLGREYEAGNAYVPTLVEHAREEGLYEPFDPSRVEKGDVIVYDGDEHVVMADGEGGYIGNSSSQQRVVHGSDYNEMGSLTPTGLIKTGKGSGEIRSRDFDDYFEEEPYNGELKPLDEEEAFIDFPEYDGPDPIEEMRKDAVELMSFDEPKPEATVKDILIDHGGDPASLPEYRPGRDIGPDEQVSRQDILERAEELFTPVYDGYLKPGVDGLLRTETGELRTGRWGDIDAMAHEIGHLVDRRTNNGQLSTEIFEELRSIVDSDAHPEMTAHDIVREGTAGYFREFLEDPRRAAEFSPEYTKAFIEGLNKDPDLKRRVLDMQDIYRRYKEQNPEAKWGSTITYGDKPKNRTFTEKIKDGAKSLYKNMVDDLTDLKGIDKLRAELKGKDELSTNESLYKMARLSRGQASAYTDLLINGEDAATSIKALNKALGDKGIMPHDVTLSSILGSIKSMKDTPEGAAFMEAGKFKDAAQALDAYLAAQRFDELRSIDLKKVRRVLDDMEESFKNHEQAGFADSGQLEYMQEQLAQELGPDFQEAFTSALKDTYGRKEGVPVDGIHVHETYPGSFLFDLQPVMERLYTNLSALKEKYAEDYAAPGDLMDAKKVIRSAPKELKEAAEGIYKLQDNVMRAYTDAGIISPEAYMAMGKYKKYIPLATDFGPEGVSGMFKGKDGFFDLSDDIKSQEAKPEAEKYKPIKSPLATMVGNINQMLDKVVKNNIGKMLVEDIGEKNGAHLATEVKGAPDPHNHTFSVWKEGERHTYQTTPEIYNILKSCGDDPVCQNFVYNTLKMGAQVTRMANTTTLAFGIANGIRDVLMTTLRTENRWSDNLNPLKPGYFKALGHILNHIITGKDEVIAEYNATGAKSSTITNYDRDALHHTIAKLAGEETLRERVASGLDKLTLLNDVVETLPRLREYMIVRDRGGSFEDAAFAARNVTIDFSRAGTEGRHLNQLTAFANAVIQGTDTFIGTVGKGFTKGHREKFAKDIAGITALATAYWALSRSQGWYDDRPDYEKTGFFLLPDPTGNMLSKDGIIKLPKAQELGIFINAYEGVLDACLGGKDAGNIFRGWAGGAVDTVLPSLMSNAWFTPVELMANYSFFTDGEIVPSSKQKLPANQQATDRTSTIARGIGSITDAMTSDINKIFGTKFEGVSPIKADYVGQALGGGWYKGISAGMDKLAGNGEDKSIPANILGFDRFQGKATSSKALSEYYERKNELQTKYAGISDHLSAKQADTKKDTKLAMMGHADAHNYKQIKNVDKAFAKLNHLEKTGKMTHEQVQKKKIDIAKAIKWLD